MHYDLICQLRLEANISWALKGILAVFEYEHLGTNEYQVGSGEAKHSNRSCYANLQLSRTIIRQL